MCQTYWTCSWREGRVSLQVPAGVPFTSWVNSQKEPWQWALGYLKGHKLVFVTLTLNWHNVITISFYSHAPHKDIMSPILKRRDPAPRGRGHQAQSQRFSSSATHSRKESGNIRVGGPDPYIWLPSLPSSLQCQLVLPPAGSCRHCRGPSCPTRLSQASLPGTQPLRPVVWRAASPLTEGPDMGLIWQGQDWRPTVPNVRSCSLRC